MTFINIKFDDLATEMVL